MSFNATVFRVLIASPGDLQEERRIIAETIHRWNVTESEQMHAVLLPVMWETDTAPELGYHPQEIVNRQLVGKCDLLIGAFWTRFGTPTERFTSGTLEEIEKFVADGKPALLYFSSKPVDPSQLDPEQLQQVREAKARFMREGIVGHFSSSYELREKLAHNLRVHVQKLNSRRVEGASEGPEKPHVDSSRPDRTSHQFSYQEYWTGLRVKLSQSNPSLRPPTVGESNWVRFPAGTGARIHAFASVRERAIGVELVLDRPSGAEMITKLAARRSAIEAMMGESLDWKEHRGSYRVVCREGGFDPADRTDWARQYEWFSSKLDRYYRVLVTQLRS